MFGTPMPVARHTVSEEKEKWYSSPTKLEKFVLMYFSLADTFSRTSATSLPIFSSADFVSGNNEEIVCGNKVSEVTVYRAMQANYLLMAE